MRLIPLSCILTAALLVLPSARAALETWTAADGQRTIRAEFLGLAGDRVTMRTIDGRTQTFAITMLSEADQQRVREAEPAGTATAARSGSGAAAAAERSALQQQFEGKLVKLEDGRFEDTEIEGAPEYFILYYSAAWCGPCRQTAPHSVEFYNEHVADNPKVELVMVNLDPEKDPAEEWAAEVGMPWPVLLQDEAGGVDAVAANQPRGIPTMILVDGDGKKIAEGRVPEMEAALEDL